MKKIKSEKSLFKQNSKIAIAVTMLAVPMLYSPSTIFAQEKKVILDQLHTQEQPSDFTIYMKFTGTDDEFSIVGTDNNKHAILQNKKGELCWMDANTGNLKFLPKDFKFSHMGYKFETQVHLLGVNKNGDAIYIDALKKKFYLNQSTGEQIFVK